MIPSALLQVKNLQTHFLLGRAGLIGEKLYSKAVDDISFEIAEAQVLSLVGESGCGKTTVGRTLTKLERATGGQALYNGQDILPMSQARFRPLRRDIQMIFQDPFASLNPRLTIEQTLSEPLRIHKLAGSKQESREAIADMLVQVGLNPKVMGQFPHEFSGGQRQRIGIARVMLVRPRLIIADEAVSALDVSIQAQVLNLLKELQQKNGISMLFISHDLGVVRHMSDKIAVMSKGKIIEMGDKHSIFNNTQHIYTRKLLESIPRVRHSKRVA